MSKQETFDQAVKRHLSRYRREHLGIEEDGVWNGLEYSHILPKQVSDLNILESIQMAFRDYDRNAKIKRHKGFPNLNSSQAMALNFWFPFCPEGEALLGWGCSERLSQLLGVEPFGIKSAKFEAELNPNEKTQIDWWCNTPSGDQLFCEVKYTESLGTAADPDTNYEQQWKDVYYDDLALLVNKDPLNDFEYFKKNYQIFRNIWHLRLGNGSKKNNLIFLLPKKSPSFKKLKESLEIIAPPETLAHGRIITLSIETALLSLLSESSSLREHRHWRLFAHKYCPWVFENYTS